MQEGGSLFVERGLRLGGFKGSLDELMRRATRDEETGLKFI